MQLRLLGGGRYGEDRTQSRAGASGQHPWPRCLTSEGWAPRFQSHGQIHQQNRRGRGLKGNRPYRPRRWTGPGRAPGTVSGGGAEVLRAAHQRGAGMGGVLPVLQRVEGAPPDGLESLPCEGPVLHPPAQGRDCVTTAGAPRQR